VAVIYDPKLTDELQVILSLIQLVVEFVAVEYVDLLAAGLLGETVPVKLLFNVKLPFKLASPLTNNLPFSEISSLTIS
jgi:hypothetical protein